jgi:membrane protein implicated in regulation of membrane protease activity
MFGVIAASAPASSMVTPGLLGFGVFAALAVALVFLLKSMNKQFRKITPPPAPGPGTASGGEDPARQEAPR